MADDNDDKSMVHVGDSGDEDRQGGAGIDIMDLGGGADTAKSGGGSYNIILGGSGADDLTSDGFRDVVLGGSGDDTITVNGFCAIVRGGSGADTIWGLDNAWSIESLRGDGGNDIIYGRAGWDIIYGGAGDDTIYGGEGRDKIVGGEGDDTLEGGSGKDIFYFWEGHGTDTVTDFNVAEDKIYLRYFDKTITWDQLSEKITTVTDPNDDSIVTGVQIDLRAWGGGTVILEGVTAVTDLTEDMFYLDTIAGGDDDDTISGGTDDDTMSGGGDGDSDTFVFDEDHGNDTITDFDIANDMLDLTDFAASITWEQLQAAMTDVEDDPNTPETESGTIIDLTAWGGGTITLEGVSRSALTAGNFVLDRLHGEDDSNDRIKGGTSDDTMSGGSGADTFYFYEGHGHDTITDFSTTEGDVISLRCLGGEITWEALSAKFEQIEDDASTTGVDETATVIDLSDWGGDTITLTGVTATDLTEDMFYLPDGSRTSYTIGNSDDETLTGGAGRDRIFGEEGNDTISGGEGHDWLFGGEGDDALDGGEGNDLLMGGEGADTLTGGMGDDMLIGGEGDDTLTGGAGADTFVFGEDSGADTITDFDTANDKIHLTSLARTITWEQLQTAISAIEDDPNTPETESGTTIDLSAWGGGTITLTGVTSTDLTEDMFVLDQITGSDGVDDVLRGGNSDDTMTGGTGADTFVFNEKSGADTITDFSTTDDKIDLTAFDVSITWQQLQAVISAIEDDTSTTDVDESGTLIDLSSFGGGSITLTGVTSTDLTADMFILDDFAGTDGDDVMEGTSADNRLTGGEGADTFVFNKDSGDDTITDFTAGTDMIDLSAIVSITGLGNLRCWQDGDDAVIDLGYHGGGTITLEGVSLSDLSSSDFVFYQDTYTGTESADTLTGGAGDDTITGLGGDDTMTGGEGEDTFVFASGHGSDTITDFTNGEDTIDLSAFTEISGFGDLTATQNGSDTVITIPGGGTITLQGFTLSDLDETDFAFHDSTSMDGQQDSI